MRNIGKTIEIAGDVTKVTGAVVVPFNPPLGEGIITAGEVISKTGTGLQIIAEVKEENYNNVKRTIAIESFSFLMTSGVNKLIDNSGLDKLSKHSSGTEATFKSRANMVIDAVTKGVENNNSNDKRENN
ncbi:MAG: hypothetical protein KDC57_06650 [Saprospiraceae bacterium]|nr:hypothetical protein [Saprospiraceae bacterium]